MVTPIITTWTMIIAFAAESIISTFWAVDAFLWHFQADQIYRTTFEWPRYNYAIGIYELFKIAYGTVLMATDMLCCACLVLDAIFSLEYLSLITSKKVRRKALRKVRRKVRRKIRRLYRIVYLNVWLYYRFFLLWMEWVMDMVLFFSSLITSKKVRKALRRVRRKVRRKVRRLYRIVYLNVWLYYRFFLLWMEWVMDMVLFFDERLAMNVDWHRPRVYRAQW